MNFSLSPTNKSPIGQVEPATGLDTQRRSNSQALARFGIESRPPIRRSPARLIFGLDLTGSREPTLKQARIATAAMFDAIAAFGTIMVKLAWYRGDGECKQGEWSDDPGAVSRQMQKLSCRAGQTQIARLLRIALGEDEKPSGVVFIGDCCEDDPGEVIRAADELGKKAIPVYVFHEIAFNHPAVLNATWIFQAVAERSGGVYTQFGENSGAALREMLSSVAAFSLAGAEGVRKLALPVSPEAQQLQRRLCLGAGNGK
jgi:hypothetical protein